MTKSLEDIQNSCDGAFDLRTVFDNVYESVFIDEVHVSDLGNKIISEKLYELSLPMIQAKISN